MNKVKQLQIERDELKEKLAKSDAINSQFRKEIDALTDENERLKKEMSASYEIINGAKKSVQTAREKAKNAKECSKRIKRKHETLIKKLQNNTTDEPMKFRRNFPEKGKSCKNAVYIPES